MSLRFGQFSFYLGKKELPTYWASTFELIRDRYLESWAASTLHSVSHGIYLKR